MMLIDQLKAVLGSSFVLHTKCLNFHWNVECDNFPQYHEFFGNMAEEIYDNAVDRTAEFIRVLDSYAPGSLTRFISLSVVPEQPNIPKASIMMTELLEDHAAIITLLNDAFTLATNENHQGVANFLAERLAAHGKHVWQLRSILKARA